MDTEIERKFLLKGPCPRPKTGRVIQQAFFEVPNLGTLRVRVNNFNVDGKPNQAVIQMKNRIGEFSVLESTMEIPIDVAKNYFKTITPITKARHVIPYGKDDLAWELDSFVGDNEGLQFVEIEIPFEDYKLEIPDWVGKEVTGDPRYINANLFNNPYKNWKNET